jgi:pullulanase-type alpha-1,6-glucosidase
VVVTPPVDAALDIGNTAAHAVVLRAVPANADGAGIGSGGGTSGDATSLTIHYQRPDANYTDWKLHTFGAAKPTEWTAGLVAARTDAFGGVFEVPLAAGSGSVGYIFHKGDEKDHNGADQSYTLNAGANEIWRIKGDSATYTANPSGAPAPDIKTVRVHYKRYVSDYAQWGLHLWSTSGIDTSRLSGLALDDWGKAVTFDKMPGYAASASEVVFDLPVLNPQGDANRKSVEFIIHGVAPKQDDKDGRSNNIRVDFGSLKIAAQVGEIWLVQQDATVYQAVPDLRSSSLSEARALWLSKTWVQWPKVNAAGTVKLYYSTTGQVKARKDEPVSGADGSITLEQVTTYLPAPDSRFKWVGGGAVFQVKTADVAQLPDLHKKQLVLVQEDSAGKVQNATMTQTPGALDELYAAASTAGTLGATVSGGSTSFKLWAPTAQKVTVFTYDSPSGAAVTVDDLAFDTATGIWSVSKSADLTGKYYRYAVEVFVRGVGVVRNLVTDPYSLSLTTDSKRSYIANLNAASLKPAGWDAVTPPAKVAAGTDMSIYELHVRDFSANDATVTSANRGKYLAFTEDGSNGMKHLKALADAGLTDVHLLPTFDLASVQESGCSSAQPSNGLAGDDLGQRDFVKAIAGTDCFNWGYDPYHYTAPEGSYASDAADGAKRILEFRAMVKGLTDAGLRVGMDVVYNHTTASGQNEKSVLDRIVPGYYHRLTDSGTVLRDSCCDDTATENMMMAKLMTDSVSIWARDYKISSFRFDLMSFHSRAVMKDLKVKVAVAAGRDVQLLGEGWNFGAIKDGARFEQSTQGNMKGDGIGTFGDKMRDAVRGGGCCDSAGDLVKAQGFVNGLVYDPNPSNTGRPLNDLRYLGDLIKGALAGSIRDYTITTHWDATMPLSDLGGVGYAVQPDEVVNYVENHDNQTLFDVNVMKMPTSTSRDDRTRAQVLGAATVAFAQGVAYYHAGVDTLRSKSLDRNSYDSGDWFNRLDWSYLSNNFGVGVPPEGDSTTVNLMKPFLGNAAIKPTGSEIAWTRDAFRDLLKIRASSSLFRLRTAADIKSRLTFHNLGSSQVPTVLVGQLSGVSPSVYAGAGFKEVVYFLNVDKVPQTLTLAALKNKGYVLHPVHTAAGAADTRAATATYMTGTGAFQIPARTAVVFVLN